MIELINNHGVARKLGEPSVFDPQARVRVTLKPKVRFTTSCEWCSNIAHQGAKEIAVEIEPGQSEFVEFVRR